MARERIVRDKILGSYNFTFPNGPCKSDGCYHLHLHNAEGKTISRIVKAKTIEELKDKIYKYHKDMLPSSLTFAEMFQQAQQDVFRYVKQDSDAYHSKLNSFNRRQQLFDRFITGTSWEKKKITTFTVQDIDDLILYNLQRYDLRTRALSSLKSIVRMTFDYAISHGCIKYNPYPDLDSRRYRDLLVPDAPQAGRWNSSLSVRCEEARFRPFVWKISNGDVSQGCIFIERCWKSGTLTVTTRLDTIP